MGAALSMLQDFFTKNIINVVLQTTQILPDGLVIMTGFYALLTLSASFAVMFGGLVESVAIFQAIQRAALYLGISESAVSDAKCRTGFRSPDLTTLSMFSRDLRPSFPSAPLYILSVAAAYIFSSLNAQSEELQALGAAYSSRYYISITLLCTLILVFMLFRLYNGCDNFGVLVSTVPIGLAIGALVFEQNRRLFGPTMVNLLGIPLIANKATISVCKATS
jgi:hypothetical protein